MRQIYANKTCYCAHGHRVLYDLDEEVSLFANFMPRTWQEITI